MRCAITLARLDMSDLSPWLRFLLAVLATWRVTHLLAREDGPFDIVLRLRASLGHGVLGKLFDCFYCLSVWVAAAITWLAFREPWDIFLGWLALSGAACLLDQTFQKPVVIEPLSNSSEGDVN
jgi:hypothetical protein